MKIIDYEEGQQGVSITLSISNNSSRKSEGVLFIMLGYNDSTVFENDTFYGFARFKVFNHSVIQILPREEKILKIGLIPGFGVKRILAVYCLNSSSPYETNSYDPIVIRKDEVLWVQTWIG
jgi:hypothetical protein